MGVYPGDKPPTTEERAELKATLLEDRRPAYIPWMVREFGAQAGLFISQLLFWEGKGHDPDGWIYKTEQDMEQETGLSRWQQRKARKVLKGKGVLEEVLRGLPRRLHYRVDLLALMAISNGEPLPSTTDERLKDPEDLWDEDKAPVVLATLRK